MTLDTTLYALAQLQASIEPTRRTFVYPPDRKQALTDFPCWINVYTLVDVLGWGELRVERYGITAQLFCKDADISRASIQATEMASAFIKAWDETHGELYAQTVGLELRTLSPTLGILEWAGQGYVGIQFLIDADISVPTDTPFPDPLIDLFQWWSGETFPTWQQDPRTWVPTNAEPALYWHYMDLPHPSTEPLTLEWSYFEATIAARIAAPARTARKLHTIALSRALGATGGSFGRDTESPWVELLDVQAWPEVTRPAEGQLQVGLRWAAPNEGACQPAEGGPAIPFGDAILTYADIPGSYGPSVTVTAPPGEEP